MTRLESAVNTVLEQLKHELASETWESRRRYFNQMLYCAESLGISEPCTELYEAFIADDHGSHERRSMHWRCVRLIDRAAGTKAKTEHGILFNEPTLPSEAETQMFFSTQGYPVAADVNIDYIIVKSEIEMRYLQLTESTTGQYKHSWIDIRRYFHDAGTTTYDETLLQKYVREIGVLRNSGSMKEWKWKINRKAAYVLIEVANTGKFHWKSISEGTSSDNPELETIRLQYIGSLEQRNFSRSTVTLYDFVLRRMLSFVGFETSNGLASLDPASIQSVILSFSQVCSKRSMATILPILRSQLKYFYDSGLAQSDLSGIVLSAFVQKGSAATYISEPDQEKLVAKLDDKSMRDKAIILLALKLGLRDCDICGLTFKDIDWQRDRISLNQKKTGEPLVLPLFPDLGNALSDYILNERPKRADIYQYVFLREQAPFNKLNTAYHICANLLKQLDIDPVNGNAKGPHTLRYSMVHRLLSAKVPHQVITDALGHTSKESNKPYISMEDNMLRMCALDLSVIGRVTWEGGASNG
jgi:integrase